MKYSFVGKYFGIYWNKMKQTFVKTKFLLGKQHCVVPLSSTLTYTTNDLSLVVYES